MYYYTSSVYPGLFHTIAMIVGILFFLVACAYVISALLYMKVGKDLKQDNLWRAWIPICNMFLLGDIVEKGLGKPDFKNKLLSSYFAFIIMALLFGLFGNAILLLYIAAFVILMVFQYQALYWIYQKYIADLAIPALILSIIVPFAAQVFAVIVCTKTGKESSI